MIRKFAEALDRFNRLSWGSLDLLFALAIVYIALSLIETAIESGGIAHWILLGGLAPIWLFTFWWALTDWHITFSINWDAKRGKPFPILFEDRETAEHYLAHEQRQDPRYAYRVVEGTEYRYRRRRILERPGAYHIVREKR